MSPYQDHFSIIYRFWLINVLPGQGTLSMIVICCSDYDVVIDVVLMIIVLYWHYNEGPYVWLIY